MGYFGREFFFSLTKKYSRTEPNIKQEVFILTPRFLYKFNK